MLVCGAPRGRTCRERWRSKGADRTVCWQDTTTHGAWLMGLPQRPVVLFLCAGPPWEGDVEAAGRSLGVSVLPIDTLRGGPQHDITRREVREALARLCSRPLAADTACVVAAHMAPPCRSFSPLNKWRGLRTIDDPEGSRAPVEYKEYLETENAVIAAAVELADILLALGRPVTFENPPSRHVEGTAWFWREMRDSASLWMVGAMRRLVDRHAMVQATAPMCVFGSEYLKYFTLLASVDLAAEVEWLGRQSCPGTGRHAAHQPARGRSASGESHARLAGRYPAGLNVWLLRILATGRMPMGGGGAWGSGSVRCDGDADGRSDGLPRGGVHDEEVGVFGERDFEEQSAEQGTRGDVVGCCVGCGPRHVLGGGGK